MKIVLKWIVGLVSLVLLVMCINGAMSLWGKIEPDLTTEDGEYDVLDGLTGNMAVDQYLRVKEKSPSFNYPTIRTGVMMFMANHGRFPTTMEEVTRSGELSPDVARDPWGNDFQLNIAQNKLTLRSAGKDRIAGTTDDVSHQMNL